MNATANNNNEKYMSEDNNKQEQSKTVAEYFKDSEYSLHIVDLFFRLLVNNDIKFFSVDSTQGDTRVSIVNQEDIDSSPKVETKEDTNANEGIHKDSKTEGSKK